MDHGSLINIENVRCRIHLFGSVSADSNVPLFIMPADDDVSDLIEGQHERLDPLIGSGEISPHILVTFESKDWNDELSPWPAPALGRKQKEFGGNSGKTLHWIQDKLIPEMTARFPGIKDGPIGLIGYSLAGMFALWAMCQTDIFTVIASCSGSLWYDGFCEYIEKNPPLSVCSVYMSLGEREEFSKNPWFSQVGNATRKIAGILKASPMCKETALVWHPGGHIDGVGERLAAAQIWMIKACGR